MCIFNACSSNHKTSVEAIDLGLPSGIKWASCNVGASSPEEFGNYYAWGETLPKNDYSMETYKLCNGSKRSMNKYCTKGYFGTVDNKAILETSDDAATVNWGEKWRIPTYKEIEELLCKCTWKWTNRNGVYGQLVTGPNGNSIFLPAAGNYEGTEVIRCGSSGCYWSATLYGARNDYATFLYLSDDINGWHADFRYYGLLIRPVTK